MIQLDAWFDGSLKSGKVGYGAYIKHGEKTIWYTSQFEYSNARNASNNVAEYKGLLSIFDFLEEEALQAVPILIRGDSKMVINQIFGTWGISGGGLYKPYFFIAKKKKSLLPYAKGCWVRREENEIADTLSKCESGRISHKVPNYFDSLLVK